MPASAYRVTLGLVFLAAASLKTHSGILGVNSRSALPMLRDPKVLWSLVAFDLVIAVGCFVRGHWNRLAAWAAIMVVVLSNFVFLDSVKNTRDLSCGCFGPLRLGVAEHVVLTMCVFFLAARTIVPSQDDLRSS